MDGGAVTGLLMALCGAAAGALAGMGMGGGTVLIPVLTLLFGVEQRMAQGVNMISFLPAALLALYIHRREGRLKERGLLAMTAAGAAGAAAGAFIAAAVEAEWLGRGFGAFLAAVSLARLLRSAKKRG